MLKHTKPTVRKNVPQEIWDKIVSNASTISARYLASTLGFKLEPRVEMHSRVWSMIFKDQTWLSIATTEHGLNPVLIGPNIHAYYRHKPAKVIPVYMALVANDMRGELRFEEKTLLNSLQPHIFDKKTGEVKFDSGITLNVTEALHSREHVFTDSPKILFSYKRKKLQSSYLCWHADNKLRTISSENVAGVGGKASKLRDISSICGISLNLPEEFSWQCTVIARGHRPEPRPSFDQHGNILGWNVM